MCNLIYLLLCNFILIEAICNMKNKKKTLKKNLWFFFKKSIIFTDTMGNTILLFPENVLLLRFSIVIPESQISY